MYQKDFAIYICINVNFHVIVSAVDYDIGAGDALITGNQFRGMKFKGINDNHLGDILIFVSKLNPLGNLQRFHMSYYS